MQHEEILHVISCRLLKPRLDKPTEEHVQLRSDVQKSLVF